MSSLNLWFLFFHILAALWLAAGVFGNAVVRAQIKRARDLASRVCGLRIAWRLMVIYTLPGALVAGLLGIHLVGARGHAFGDGWVILSLVIYLWMFVVTLVYLFPHLRRTLRAAEESLAAGRPGEDLERLAGAKLPGILADVNAVGILILTLLMVFRP